MSKIAPQAQALLKISGLRTMGGGVVGMKALRAELRALLAVAMMARRVALTNTDPGNGWTEDDWRRLDRALARLERASGTGREGGR